MTTTTTEAPAMESTATPGAGAPRRRKLRPQGPDRVGFLTEMQLATRWGRAHNTLSSWRTRPHPDLKPLQWEVHQGVVYYAIDWIREYESDQMDTALRPGSLRGAPFPNFPWRLLSELPVPQSAAQVELPLPYSATKMALSDDVAEMREARREDSEAFARLVNSILAMLEQGRAGVVDPQPQPQPRRFKSIDIAAGYALAIATDGTAWYAPVLLGLEYADWKAVAALPQHDPLLATIGRRAA